MFSNTKRFYVKKYFYGYLSKTKKNISNFKYFKNVLGHTCFLKNSEGINDKGEKINGTEINIRSHIKNSDLPNELKGKDISPINRESKEVTSGIHKTKLIIPKDIDFDIENKKLKSTNIDYDNAKTFLKYYSDKPLVDVTTGKRYKSNDEDNEDIEFISEE